MNTNRTILYACVAFLVVVALVTFVALHNHAPFTRVDFVALFAALAVFALVVHLVIDIGVSLEMRLPRHLRTLGSGYGVFDSLSSMVRRIEDVRRKVREGGLNPQEGAVEEGRLFDVFHRYFSDRRWKKVSRLKRSGKESEARQLAHEIGREHQLLEQSKSSAASDKAPSTAA